MFSSHFYLIVYLEFSPGKNYLDPSIITVIIIIIIPNCQQRCSIEQRIKVFYLRKRYRNQVNESLRNNYI